MSKAVSGFKIVTVTLPHVGQITFTEGEHVIPSRRIRHRCRRHCMTKPPVGELVGQVREFIRINAQTPELDRFKDGGMKAIIAHVVGGNADLQEEVRQGLIEHACQR